MSIKPCLATAFAILTVLAISACTPNLTAAPSEQNSATETITPSATATNLPSATPNPTASPTPVIATSAPPKAPTSPSANVANTGTRTITQSDNGATITLQVGERFLLDLGDSLDWQVEIDDPTIVSRVPGILTVKGSQGLFQANKAGQTALAARGDAPCRKAQPACMTPTFLFRLQIVVGSGADATPPAPKAVTYDDNGKTITLRVGEQFLLKLGDNFTWTITVDDPSIVSRVVNISVVRGAQGVYEAKKLARRL